jgi:hypothetical protein
MVVGREAADVEAMVAGILPTEENTKTTGPTMVQGAAITPTARAMLLAMGGTDPNQCHALSRMIPTTW